MLRYDVSGQFLIFEERDCIKIVAGSYYYPDKAPVYATVVKPFYHGPGNSSRLHIEFDVPQVSKTIMRGLRSRKTTYVSPESVKLMEVASQEPEETPPSVPDINSVLRNMDSLTLDDVEIEADIKNTIRILCIKFKQARISNNAAQTILTIGLQDCDRENEEAVASI